MEALLVLLLFCLIAIFVAAPLRRRPETESPAEREEGERAVRLADLEARKEAKYREIRDTELDHAAGKLSDAEFERQGAELRREAVEILAKIDGLGDPGKGDAPRDP